MSGISAPPTPVKFDSAGNVLANINAQNITPNANAVNVKTDASGNVLANLNAQNITPNANAVNVKTDASGNVLANINAQSITPNAVATNVKTDANGNVLANINAQSITPNVNQPPIWSYQRPSFAKTDPASSTTASSANVIYSTGKGIQILSLTGYNYIKVIIGITVASTNGATVYLYRSTVGIPSAGSAPNSGDVQLTSVSVPSTSTSTTYGKIFDYIDTVTQGTTVYYYLAVLSQSANVTVTITTNPSAPLNGILGVENTPTIEAICV